MHVIDVLRGEATEKVAQRGHDKLTTFGIGGERSAREWRAIVRQCVALGLLEVDHEAYGALRLAGESRAVLKSERTVALRTWREPKRAARTRGTGEALAGPAQALFDRLRAWRGEAARRHGVPAYVIFHDATLRDIARTRPGSLQALRGISGIGAKKLEAYGEDIVGLVSGG
jgi:ATP-dependent DNA helicase RecQ